MSRILIDVTRLLYRRVTGTLPTGIDRVGQEYVRRYGPGARAVLSLGPFSIMLSRPDSDALFRAVSGWSEPARGLALKVALKAFLWRWMALAVRGDTLFNTGHTGLENPRYAWWLRRQDARVVVVVHDLIPITHPEYCRPAEPRKHRVRMGCAARVSAGIVANSEHTLAQFRSYCESAGLPVPASVVARLGPGLAGAIPGARPLAAPYFVMVGTVEPRKNHAMMLRIWRQLAESMVERVPKLVLIGQLGWNGAGVMDSLRRCEALRGIVIERPRCGDTELATWLHHARALLFPSFAEGYGLPVTEALSQGVPVIASDLPVFRETVGDIPDYAPPSDARRWETLVADYARADSPMREAQLERMKSFSPPSWSAHFAAVDALLERLDAEARLGRRCPA
jgi:glycosyltransferase involved in cell wall biosynthesis